MNLAFKKSGYFNHQGTVWFLSAFPFQKSVEFLWGSSRKLQCEMLKRCKTFLSGIDSVEFQLVTLRSAMKVRQPQQAVRPVQKVHKVRQRPVRHSELRALDAHPPPNTIFGYLWIDMLWIAMMCLICKVPRTQRAMLGRMRRSLKDRWCFSYSLTFGMFGCPAEHGHVHRLHSARITLWFVLFLLLIVRLRLLRWFENVRRYGIFAGFNRVLTCFDIFCPRQSMSRASQRALSRWQPGWKCQWEMWKQCHWL